VRVVEAHAPAEELRSVRDEPALDPATVEAALDLARGALDVAEVGEKDGLGRPHERETARAGEPGEPEEVCVRLARGLAGRYEVADEELVEPPLGERSPQPLEAFCGDDRAHANSSFRIWSASR
jgi:hypothetical protein